MSPIMKKYFFLTLLCASSVQVFAVQPSNIIPEVFTVGIQEPSEVTANRWVKMFAENNTNTVSKKQFVRKFTDQYLNLFKENKSINKQQFIDYELFKLDEMMQKYREMSIKQAHVRFHVLDQNKDEILTLKEFQEIGLKTFDGFDKNHDGIVNQKDIALDENKNRLHGGANFKTPVSMPMATDVSGFIQQYGEGKEYVTLAMYLSEREDQYRHVNQKHDWQVSEDEYVNEFIQRYDENANHARDRMKKFYELRFEAIANGHAKIRIQDIEHFSQTLFTYWDSEKMGKIQTKP